VSWTPDPTLLAPGEASDREVANVHNVHRLTVTKYRRRHGIPSGGRMGRPAGSGAWVPASGRLQPGEATDEAVAASQGVPVSRVLRYRQRHAIAAFGRRGLMDGPDMMPIEIAD
jgi:hypothetical protein